MNYFFEWDLSKYKLNLIKHKVKFEEASTIFEDPNAITIFDEAHSDLEDRWITLGISKNGQIIVVIHNYQIRENDSYIRLISARKATKKEILRYRGIL